LNCTFKEPNADYLVIAGPTASGKTSLSFEYAENFNGEIIGCDSVQVYKGFDIGSAKPNAKELATFPHYLIDVITWEQDYDAGKYAVAALEKIREIKSRGKLPIVVGGTGLYLRALQGNNFASNLPKDAQLRVELDAMSKEALMEELKKCDPKRAADLHPNDKLRIMRAVEIFRLSGKTLEQLNTENAQQAPVLPTHEAIILNPERSVLHKRIELRVGMMLGDGLVNEVKGLLAQGCPKNAKPMQSIGYKQVVDMLDGQIKPQDLEEKIVFATRQFAKRQCTWFAKY
jgi:tRNA dimethylallyltransferase